MVSEQRLSPAHFDKYHALGNDYIVLHQKDFPTPPSASQVSAICHRNYGVGSDGILWIQHQTETGFPVIVFNPDGSQAENSGNGMRIAARYLFDHAYVGEAEFYLLAAGTRAIKSVVQDGGAMVQVDMGRASFRASEIPVAGQEREVLNEKILISDTAYTCSCVSVGNPHCVVLAAGNHKQLATTIGPLLEVHHHFPNRINVQIVSVKDRNRIAIEIWERGAGYTLASGSSSCAAAAVCNRLGLVDPDITVEMPGGVLQVAIDEHFQITLRGPVVKVAMGELSEELLL